MKEQDSLFAESGYLPGGKASLSGPPAPLLGNLACQAESIGAGYPDIHQLTFKPISAMKIDKFEAVSPPFPCGRTIPAPAVHQYLLYRTDISCVLRCRRLVYHIDQTVKSAVFDIFRYLIRRFGRRSTLSHGI